jgi:hypothetical protein
MRAVAASLALGGSVPAAPAPQTPAQNSSPQDAWKTDPEVGKAGTRVLEFLTKHSRQTEAAIQKNFDMRPEMVNDALKRLVYDGKVSKEGTGNATVYFIPSRGGTG